MELHQVSPRQERPGDRSLLADHQAGEDHEGHRQGARVLSTFTRSTKATAVVDATREQIWAVLADPDMVAQLTPLVRSITADDEGRWRWKLGGIDVLGTSMAPAFTVLMEFDPMQRIDFSPSPPPDQSERAAVTGWYVLADPPEGQRGIELSTSLEIALDLPLPRVARGAVQRSMERVIDGMGDRFSKNLLDHLAAG